MQIANGTVILSPENHQYKHGITPAEALLLKELHFQYSNGTPLGPDFVIQKGEALTVEQEGKPAEEEYFNQNTGKHVPAKPAVPAKTHPRTNAEEVERLRKKYTGNITKNGVSLPAFQAVFGMSRTVKLPETFAEIEEACGIQFHESEIPGHTEDKQRAFDLSKRTRPELCEMALALKLKIAAGDSKDFIIASIINAENKAKETAPAKEKAE
jgi:hypothetical protein